MKFFKNTKRKIMLRIADLLLQSGTNAAYGNDALVGIKNLFEKWMQREFGFCWQCQWFYLQKPNPDPVKRSGQCKVNPPVVMSLPSAKVMKADRCVYPYVKGGNWCGSFMLRRADMRLKDPTKKPRKPLIESSETAVEGLN